MRVQTTFEMQPGVEQTDIAGHSVIGFEDRDEMHRTLSVINVSRQLGNIPAMSGILALEPLPAPRSFAESQARQGKLVRFDLVDVNHLQESLGNTRRKPETLMTEEQSFMVTMMAKWMRDHGSKKGDRPEVGHAESVFSHVQLGRAICLVAAERALPEDTGLRALLKKGIVGEPKYGHTPDKRKGFVIVEASTKQFLDAF